MNKKMTKYLALLLTKYLRLIHGYYIQKYSITYLNAENITICIPFSTVLLFRRGPYAHKPQCNHHLDGCSCEMMLFIILVMDSRWQRQLIYNHSGYVASS